MSELIKVENIVKKYKTFTLDKISFNLEGGHIYGFVGENGSGKSTTMKAIADLIKVDEGNIYINGKLNKELTSEERESIGFTLDEICLPANLKIQLINRILKNAFEKWDENKFFKYLKEFNIDELIKTIKTYLVEGPQYYDVKTITNKDFKFYVEETIREVALKLLKEEVPHSIAVICDEHFEGKNIFAKIIVEKDSQKGIIIGKRGQMIKKIGIRARKQIEEYLGYAINLELVVQVEKDWKNSNKFLSKIGYK